MRVKRPVYDSSANQARTFARRTQSPRPYQVPGYMRTAAIGLPCALYVRISSAARYVDVYTCAQDMYVRVRSVVLPRQLLAVTIRWSTVARTTRICFFWRFACALLLLYPWGFITLSWTS